MFQAALGRSSRQWVSPLALAVRQHSLGDDAAAPAWLERAWDARDLYRSLLRGEPSLDGFRGDTRFEALVRKVGL